MSYTYSDDAHLGLVASYRVDDDLFPVDTSLPFPRRNHLREDVDLIKRLLSPRCRSVGSWVTDKELLRGGIANFGTLCYSGIDPYINEDPKPIVGKVVKQFPDIRERLKKDVEAAYKGDPTACGYVEIIRSYPDVQAIVVHRIVHAFYEAGAPAYARGLTECTKTESGIDIHPDTTIGDHFFVDHGTGVIIGETTTIGEWARIYQDVALSAPHSGEDEDGEHSPKKGYKRHSGIDDSIIIGTRTEVLSAVSVGDRVSVDANSWVTEDVLDHMGTYISERPTHEQKHRG